MRRFLSQSLKASLLLSVALLSGSGLLGSQRAQGADLPVGSLSLAPADAVFFSASLRGKEQYDLVMQSNAWKKVKGMPAIQMGMMLMQMQMADPRSPVGQAKAMLDQPENQELMALLADMMGTETFVYGSAEYLDLIDLFQTLQATNQFSSIASVMSGEMGEEMIEARKTVMLETVMENLDSLVAPDTVMGFKLTQSDQLDSQLDRLEKVLTPMLEEYPKLEGSLTRKKVGDTEYLTMTLNGEMLPWEEFNPEDVDLDPESRDKIIEHVKAMTLEINIGMHGEYMIVSIGDTSEHLEALGSGETLAGVKEIQKLTAHADQRITGVSYASAELMTRAGATKEDLQGLNDVAEELLAESELDEDLQKRIKADVAELIEDLGPYVPELGAVSGISFMTETGTESFTYNWGTNPVADGTKPLSLLQHVGGKPLLACVGRAKYSPESYALLVKWLKKGHGYFEEYAVPEMKQEEQDKYAAVWPQILPLLERLDKITGTEFLPALADGQSGFVLDAKISSYQWLKQLPSTATKLPLIEPALICGVSDSDLLIESMGHYRELVNDFLDKLEEISGGEAQTEFRLRAPEVRPFEFGDVYYYRLPEEAGVDKQLAPNAGLNKKVVTLSLSPRTSVRLLESTPLEVSGILESAADKPALSACYVDLASLLDALAPWLDFGVRMGAAQFSEHNLNRQRVAQDEEKEEKEEKTESADPDGPGALGDPEDDSPALRQILGQVHSVLDVIKVYQTYQSLTYLEDDIQVTHGQWKMQDTE